MDMDSKPYSLMIVDDDTANLQLMSISLEDRYKVNCVDSGDSCLKQLAGEQPDVVILDVEMPNLNGYDICRNLRQSKKTKDLPVLFLSAHSDLESKLAGYNAGGDDYLTKPVDIEELCAKVDRSIALRTEHHSKLSASKEMAKAIINDSAEYSVVLSYCEKTFSLDNYQGIASELLTALTDFDLSCCVRVHTPQEDFFLSTSGEQCTPIEEDLLKAIEWGDRITDLEKRSAFNFNHISLLIKNMPIDDSARKGRYRDHLALMLNAASSKIQNLVQIRNNEAMIMSRINSALEEISDCLDDISKDFNNREKATTLIMNNLLSEVNVAFSTLNLTMAQEDFFVKLVNQHLDKIITLFYENHQIDVKFDKVMETLTEIKTKRLSQKI